MRHLKLLIATLLVAIASLFAVSTAQAIPEFIIQCNGVQNKYATETFNNAGWHTNNEDPVKFPGQTGAVTHLHEYVGNPTTYGLSTYSTLQAANATSCSPTNPAAFGESTSRPLKDFAGYWQPMMWVGNTAYRADYARVYYTRGSAPSTATITWVPGTKMIGTTDSFSCGANTPGDTPASGQDPYDCSSPTNYVGQDDSRDGLISRVVFPQCWDGVGTAYTDFLYPTGSTCPTVASPNGDGQQHWIPQIRLSYHRSVITLPGGPTSVTFGSAPGDPNNMPFEDLHGDFMDGWNTTEINTLITRCLGPTSNGCGNGVTFATKKGGDSGTPTVNTP